MEDFTHFVGNLWNNSFSLTRNWLLPQKEWASTLPQQTYNMPDHSHPCHRGRSHCCGWGMCPPVCHPQQSPPLKALTALQLFPTLRRDTISSGQEGMKYVPGITGGTSGGILVPINSVTKVPRWAYKKTNQPKGYRHKINSVLPGKKHSENVQFFLEKTCYMLKGLSGLFNEASLAKGFLLILFCFIPSGAQPSPLLQWPWSLCHLQCYDPPTAF